MMNQQQMEHLFRHVAKYNGVAILCQYNKGKAEKNLSTKRYVGIGQYAAPIPGKGIYAPSPYAPKGYYMDIFSYETMLPSMIMKHVGNYLHEVQDTMPELSFTSMGMGLDSWFDIRNPEPKIRNKQYNYYFERFLHPLTTRYVTDEERVWLEGCANKFQGDGSMLTSKGGITDFSQSKVIDF